MNRPDYYDEFECIAGACPFTCCQQWKIAVDDDTLADWTSRKVPGRYLERNTKASGTTLNQYVRDGESGKEMTLCDNGFCPFFNEKGLCDIVLEYGEETISNTCHTFPREEHIYEDVTEQTLALGCPAVVDLLWKREAWKTVGEENTLDEYDRTYFYLRNKIIEFVSSKVYPLKDSMQMLFFILLDMFEQYEYEESIDFLTNEEINSFFKKAYTDELYKQLSAIRPEMGDNIYEQNELFLDIADNYRKKGIYASILEPLAELASYYEEDEHEDEFIEKREEFEAVWDSMEDKLRMIILEEIFSTLYMPEGDLYSIVIKAQWLGITYAVLKQMLFLTWLKDGNKKLSYEQTREVICVLIRMTGYSEEDIEEYLENSFEDIIWEWGYMNLIL